MDSLLNYKIIFAALATGAAHFLGGFDNVLTAFIVFLCLDYMTGVMAAVVTKELNSSAGLAGIIKKVMQICLVGVAVIMDDLTGTPNPYFRSAILFYLISNEGISILENVSRAGVPIPDFLKTALQQIKGREGK